MLHRLQQMLQTVKIYQKALLGKKGNMEFITLHWKNIIVLKQRLGPYRIARGIP